MCGTRTTWRWPGRGDRPPGCPPARRHSTYVVSVIGWGVKTPALLTRTSRPPRPRPPRRPSRAPPRGRRDRGHEHVAIAASDATTASAAAREEPGAPRRGRRPSRTFRDRRADAPRRRDEDRPAAARGHATRPRRPARARREARSCAARARRLRPRRPRSRPARAAPAAGRSGRPGSAAGGSLSRPRRRAARRAGVADHVAPPRPRQAGFGVLREGSTNTAIAASWRTSTVNHRSATVYVRPMDITANHRLATFGRVDQA